MLGKTAARGLRHFFESTAEKWRQRAADASRIVEEIQSGTRRTIGRSAPNLLDMWRAWDFDDSGRVSMVNCFINGAIADLNLWKSVFDHFVFGGDFGGVATSRLASSTFAHCVFRECSFSRIELEDCRFQGCVFIDCRFDASVSMERVWFDECYGLEVSAGLHRVRVVGSPSENHHLAEAIADLPFPFAMRHWSWERLRTFGLLPLFGVSLSALVAVPAAMGLLAVYNRQVGAWHGWAAEHAGAAPFAALVRFIERLEPAAVPSLSLVLLLATLLLGIASTIFSFFCPPRIKEFSLERWTDELQQHSVNYIPLSWTRPVLRCIAGACYWLGGSLAGLVLLSKIISAGWFIIQNTRWPFPLW